jgi:hypothetical protein
MALWSTAVPRRLRARQDHARSRQSTFGKASSTTGWLRFALVLAVNNRQGAMSNLNDGTEDLDTALARTSPSHEIQVQGAVVLFIARITTRTHSSFSEH